jgi:hypothetical protein
MTLQTAKFRYLMRNEDDAADSDAAPGIAVNCARFDAVLGTSAQCSPARDNCSALRPSGGHAILSG